MDNTNSANNTRTWNAAVNVKWIIIPGLQYQGTYSYASSSATTKKYATEQSFHITQYRGFEYGSVGSTAPEMGMTKLPFGGILETGNTTTSTFVARNAFVYDHIFKDEHRMTLQAGLETQSVNMDGGTNLRYGYLHFRGETFATPPKDYLPVGASATTTPTDNSATVYGSATALNKIDNKISEYATAVYIFRDRYVVNGSARLDASNRFGQDYNKRFAPTWSVGVKWRAGREEFLHKNASWIDHLDFLASYGYQGNAVQSVSPHLIANNPGLVGLGNYYQQYILRIRSLPYPNLGWEKTKTGNIGAELSLFNGRIGFEGNYFKKTSNVLSSRDIGYENGMANGLVSGSTMTNTGYDFTVTMTPIRTRDFSWQLSVNTAVVRNKIEKNGRVNNINDYTAGTCIVEGEPYSTFYSYAFTGLNPADGTPLFNNIEVTGLDGPMDFLIKSGKFTPDFSGGLNTQLRYRNIALYALFYVQLGGERRLPKLYDVTSNNGTPTPEHNLSNRLTQRWQKPGDEEFTDIPSIPGVGATQVYLPLTQTSTRTLKNPYDLYNLSDQQAASSDMIRCRSISLSYDVNVARLKGLDRLQIRVSMTNPFLYAFSSKWRGVDPETGDWPARRTTSLSLQMMF
ncbi:hypothetical protein AGMMS50239_09670 [Bacteroidia bacterium]|nr:hypothetical protein AGMMS50239_09670 [Bacteroidia bacterium]